MLHTLVHLDSTVLVVLLLPISFGIWLRLRNSKLLLPLPPGPKGLPLIQNLLDIPTKDYKVFTDWGRKYGESIQYPVVLGG